MVAIFAQLKWRLVTSRIRSVRGGTRAWMIVGWCVAVLLLALVLVGLVLLRSQPELARTLVTTLFTAQFLAWGLAPLIAFGIDETVDPARFALLPIREDVLQRGLLVTALIGYLPVVNAVLLIGAAVALSTQWWMLPIALVAVAVQLLICVLFSRALSTAMSGLMSGRRGRDLGVMIGFAVIVGYMLLNFALNSVGQQGNGDEFGAKVSSVAAGLGWAPPGALAQLPGFLADGRGVRAVVAVITAAACAAVLWWWWSGALRASLTTMPSDTENAARSTGRSGRAVATSTTGMMSLVADRNRVLAWRDPLRRVSWLLVLFLAFVWPFLVIRGHGSLFAVTFPAILAGSLVADCYGTDGSGVWLHMVAFADRTRARGELLGHAVTVVLPGAVAMTAAVCLHAAIRGDWAWAPAGVGTAVGGLLGGVAAAGYFSARLPYAVRQSRKSMFASSIAGQKGRTAGASLGMLAGGILTIIPAAVFAILAVTMDVSFGWIALVLGPLVGLAAVWISSGVAARTYLERGPEILAVVAAGDRV